MSRPLRVLMIEDCQSDAILIVRSLQRSDYTVIHERVDTAKDMEAALDRQTWDIVIADYHLPDFSAPEALKLVQAKNLDLPFIIVSGSIGEEIAVAAMKAGAHDYLMKDNLARLVPAVERELREAEERRQRREAEQALQDAEEMRQELAREKELNDLKSSFISMVSHEFRTPLSAIILSVRLLETLGDRVPTEKKQEYLDRIRLSAERMTHLLDEVLFLGKADANRVVLNPISLDLVQFCHDILADLRLVDNDNHAITFNCPHESLPAYMDELLLRHILTNLISNAIKYSPNGSKVRCMLDSNQEQVIFHIADEGIGITLDDQERLFESFHRGKNVGKIPGTGLGMAIVKRSVELHHGQIYVDSAIDRGTQVTVILPISLEDHLASNS